MTGPADALPIAAVLQRVRAALIEGPNLVLAAPPGAGKTTGVPPALIDAPWREGRRILMLEPRRIAARAAAERIAETLGEPVGGRAGYRIRGEARVSDSTEIEVVTEGVLTRMLQADPELPGVAAVLFDEIHERSIHSDLGLALALEGQAALRPDLRLVAMSATLESGRLAALMPGAAVIESAGRSFPVETRWLARPWRGGRGEAVRFEDAAAGLIAQAAAETAAETASETTAETTGGILAFLPGAGEIARVAARLAGRVGDAVILPLHGSLPFAAQRRALAPDARGRRRIVLATAIAETSLTVPDITVVVDCGRARRARFSPATGMSRLVTEPVSRAEAEQRRGRAGRLAPGLCYRMWTRGEEGALPAAAPPEILSADLAPLALELAAWGAGEDTSLRFLDPPPAPALAEARALLIRLGALDADGRITRAGREMARFPAHPRLAHMVLAAREAGHGPEAGLIAALLGERDPGRGGGTADLAPRLAALGREAEASMELEAGAARRIRAEARRLAGRAGDPARAARAAGAAGALLSLAWPDRVGLGRAAGGGRYLLANGRGAALAPGDPLAAHRLIVAAEVEDKSREGTIRLATALDEADLRRLHAGAIETVETVDWSPRTGRVEARRREMFGALALDDRPWRDAPAEALGRALAEGIRATGPGAIPWPKPARALRARVAWLKAQGGGAGDAVAETLPDLSDTALMTTLDDWLVPHLAGMTRLQDLARLDLTGLLSGLIGREGMRTLDRAAPAWFETPLGGRAAIDYSGEVPKITLRVQELFGVTRHPSVGAPPVALLIELLSPAGRPVQTTRDLPGFWRNSYADVRKEIRARYPKHPWPEDPAAAPPTRRATPRKRRG